MAGPPSAPSKSSRCVSRLICGGAYAPGDVSAAFLASSYWMPLMRFLVIVRDAALKICDATTIAAAPLPWCASRGPEMPWCLPTCQWFSLATETCSANACSPTLVFKSVSIAGVNLLLPLVYVANEWLTSSCFSYAAAAGQCTNRRNSRFAMVGAYVLLFDGHVSPDSLLLPRNRPGAAAVAPFSASAPALAAAPPGSAS